MEINKFWEWIDSKRGGMSWREIERIGGMANGTISRRFKERAAPTLGNCEALATALKLMPREVLIKAGLIDETLRDLEDATLQQVVAIMKQLSPEARAKVAEYASFLLSQKSGQRSS